MCENGANSCLPLWGAGVRSQHHGLMLINPLHPLLLPRAACALQQGGVWLCAAARWPQGWPHRVIPALPLALLAPHMQRDWVSKSVS